jgi:energy-coupling factor transport system permease protein
MTFNGRAWIAWIAIVAILTMVTRNPLYTMILFLVTRLVMVAFGREDLVVPLSLWRIGVIMIGFSVLYNGLFVHVGTTVLFSLPAWPLIGGPVTAEALVAGFVNGLILVTLLSTFAVLNAIVPLKELVRLAPAALQDFGVVVMVALTYVPETRRHYERIRQAQAIRGHQLRGLGDWRPIILPLLIGGLERAMHLAETMVARGYGSTERFGGRPTESAAIFTGLLAAAVGWLMIAIGLGLGWVLLLAGSGVMATLLWRRGRRLRRSGYSSSPWRPRDSLLVCTSVATLILAIVPWSFANQTSLVYSPYLTLSPPDFDWLYGLVFMALAWPAFAAVLGDHRATAA